MSISPAQFREMQARTARANCRDIGLPADAVPVACESNLHAQIADECDRRGWLYFHGAMCQRTARTLGEPDYIICCDGGRLLMVECKTKTGKLSPAQQAVAAHAAKLGHKVHVVRSMQEFLNLL